MTSETADHAYRIFLDKRSDLENYLLTDLNESDVRLKIIDLVLIEILGWPRDHIHTESPSSEGFLDYLLKGKDKRGLLVLEAKRTGVLTPATASDRRATLSLRGNVLKPLQEGVAQAFRYASTCGVPNAVLCDGRTWLFFKAFRGDGVPPMEGKAILFPSIHSIGENFAEFFELGSLHGVTNRYNQVWLNRAEGKSPALEEKQYVVSPPDRAKMHSRSELAKDASLLFKQFFSRLTDSEDKEMLRECFAETAESRSADYDLQKIVEKLINTTVTIEASEGLQLQREIERVIKSASSQSVIIVGNKGSGKSTFIDRFFEIVLPTELRKQCIVARVDLQKHFGNHDKLIEWAINQLASDLEREVCAHNPPSFDDLQGIFHGEYLSWCNGPYKHLYDSNKIAFKIEFGKHMEAERTLNKENYIRLLLKRAFHGQRRLPCLIFDNADQFDATTQDAIYQLAHALGEEAPSLTIVPITDRTVWRLSKAGALQSYPAKTFFLPPPEVKQVLAKRVDFVRGKLELESGAALHYFSAKGFSIELSDLTKFAEAIEHLFVKIDFVSGLIGRLANFDIRRMLELAERVFLSPEIRIDEVLRQAYHVQSAYSDILRIHRAILKGEYDRYNENENSFVCNLFWTDPQNPSTPLISFYIISLLNNKRGNPGGDSEDKSWLVSELIEFLSVCGPEREAILDHLDRLYEWRLIEDMDPTTERISEASKIYLRDSGVAHIELALKSRVYIEQMALATGVNSLSLHEQMENLVKQATGDSFRKIHRKFVEYILAVDAGRFQTPNAKEYRTLNESRNLFQSIIANSESSTRKSSSFGKHTKRTKGSKRASSIRRGSTKRRR